MTENSRIENILRKFTEADNKHISLTSEEGYMLAIELRMLQLENTAIRASHQATLFDYTELAVRCIQVLSQHTDNSTSLAALATFINSKVNPAQLPPEYGFAVAKQGLIDGK